MHGLKTISKLNNPNGLRDWEVRNVRQAATMWGWIKIGGFTMAIITLAIYAIKLV